jgi:hypothetical protein
MIKKSISKSDGFLYRGYTYEQEMEFKRIRENFHQKETGVKDGVHD